MGELSVKEQTADIQRKNRTDGMLEMLIGGVIMAWLIVIFDALTHKPLWPAAIPVTAGLIFRLIRIYFHRNTYHKS